MGLTEDLEAVADPQHRAAAAGELAGILGYTEEELVSVDIIGRRESGFLIKGDNLSGPVADTVRPGAGPRGVSTVVSAEGMSRSASAASASKRSGETEVMSAC